MAESLNINDFKGYFTQGARPNLYKVRMEKLGGKLEFLCKASSLPSSTVEAIDVPYLGRQIKVVITSYSIHYTKLYENGQEVCLLYDCLKYL